MSSKSSKKSSGVYWAGTYYNFTAIYFLSLLKTSDEKYKFDINKFLLYFTKGIIPYKL